MSLDSGSYLKEIEKGNNDKVATFIKCGIIQLEADEYFTENKGVIQFQTILEQGVKESEFLIQFATTAETLIKDYHRKYMQKRPLSTIDIGLRSIIINVSEQFLFLRLQSIASEAIRILTEINPNRVTDLLGCTDKIWKGQKEDTLNILTYFQEQYQRLECSTTCQKLQEFISVINKLSTVENEEDE
jgi:hypothetical protein